MVILGCGSYGIVIYGPRFPVNNESVNLIKNLNQVGKILYMQDSRNRFIPSPYVDFSTEYTNILDLMSKYPNIFDSQYFMLPIGGGPVNKTEIFNQLSNDFQSYYNLTWASNSNKQHKFFAYLLSYSCDLYQIVYEKGELISSNINVFYNGIVRLQRILSISSRERIYFDDIKLDNLVLHNQLIKIIDYSEIINLNILQTNTKFQSQFTDSKLEHIYYFPYPILHNLLLYEFIGKIKLIGPIGLVENLKLKSNSNSNSNPYPYPYPMLNYYSLLHLVSTEKENDNGIKHIIKSITNIMYVFDTFIPNHTIELDMFNSKHIDKIDCVGKQTKTVQCILDEIIDDVFNICNPDTEPNIIINNLMNKILNDISEQINNNSNINNNNNNDTNTDTNTDTDTCINSKYDDDIQDISKFSEKVKVSIQDYKNLMLKILFFNNLNFAQCEYNKKTINEIMHNYKIFINAIFGKNLTNKLAYLLEKINMYSYGFIIISWINKNISLIKLVANLYFKPEPLPVAINDFEELKTILEKMFDIIVSCCVSIITIEDEIYFSCVNMASLKNICKSDKNNNEIQTNLKML
jgi:hypothetical protein